MKRRLFNLLAAASLVMCVILVALAVISLRFHFELVYVEPTDELQFERRGELRLRDDGIVTGDLSMSMSGSLDPEMRVRRLVLALDRGAIVYIQSRIHPLEALFAGERYGWQFRRFDFPPERRWMWIEIVSSGVGTSAAWLPLWMPILLTAVLPAVGIARFYRKRQRRRYGHCHTCGYNLTGNVSGVCPECGTAVPQRGAARDGGR